VWIRTVGRTIGGIIMLTAESLGRWEHKFILNWRHGKGLGRKGFRNGRENRERHVNKVW
jgi:hypothetical protein